MDNSWASLGQFLVLTYSRNFALRSGSKEVNEKNEGGEIMRKRGGKCTFIGLFAEDLLGNVDHGKLDEVRDEARVGAVVSDGRGTAIVGPRGDELVHLVVASIQRELGRIYAEVSRLDRSRGHQNEPC